MDTNYAATRIYETTGETTEVAQRRQDAEIAILKKVNETGTTQATSVTLDVQRPFKWKVIPYHGWYDLARGVFRA